MKKGFTLIELLAVILILGIIALIAIPTVNKILSEAREGAFRTSSDNIINSIEEECQTSLIKGETPILSYTFSKGKPSSKLNVKGTMPDDGYVFLDRNCSITNFFLKDQNNVYSNGEDIRNEYMLMASTEENTSIFKTIYPTFYDHIVSVNFINNLNIPAEAIEIKNPSVSEAQKIKSWLIENGGKYTLYIGSDKTIYANYESQYLFKDMISVTNINLDNFNTSFTTNMAYFFYNLQELMSLNVNNLSVSNVKNMNAMFYNLKKIKTLDLSNWDTSNLINMDCMFYGCDMITNLDLTNFDTKNVTNMAMTFTNCYSLTSLNISNWVTNKVTNMNQMFTNCTRLTSLDLSSFDTSKVTDMYGIFWSCGSLKTLNVSHFNVNNVTNMTDLFHSCLELVSLDISNWNITNTDDLTDSFYNCTKLKNITMNNSNYVSINKIINVLPTRNAVDPGFLIITENSNIDTLTLNNKYWNYQNKIDVRLSSGFVGFDDGIFVESNTSQCSEFINSAPLTTYNNNNTLFIYYYKDNKEFINSILHVTDSFTTPNETGYIRICRDGTIDSTIYLYKLN